MNKKVTVIGAAIIDIMAGAIDKDLFDRGSVPADRMEMTCDGDSVHVVIRERE